MAAEDLGRLMMEVALGEVTVLMVKFVMIGGFLASEVMILG